MPGDQPPKVGQRPQTGGGGSLADQILGRKPGDTTKPNPPADTTPKPADTTPKPADTTPKPADTTPKPADATPKPKLPEVKIEPTDTVIAASFRTPPADKGSIDDKIWNTKAYNALEISDVPPNAILAHWKDENGYFFYFKDKANNPLEKTVHYYPGNLEKIAINGQTIVQDVKYERQRVEEALARKSGINITKGVLTIAADDKDFDSKIKNEYYHTINVSGLPKGTKVEHAMDDKGFYFTMNGDGKKHYYPKNVKQLGFDGQEKPEHDMVKARMQAVDTFSKDKFGGFQDFSRVRHNQMAEANQVMTFGFTMDSKARGSLDMLEKNLEDAIKADEKHPYFKYLLANVKVAQAMGAVRDLALAGESVKNPKVLDKLEKADKLLDDVIAGSDQRLRKINRYPRPNAQLLPMAPFAGYGPDPTLDGYYAFWASPYDQAGWMKPQLRFIRGLVETEAIALPPERPPGSRR